MLNLLDQLQGISVPVRSAPAVSLETVRADPLLAGVRCCLVSWGYLGPQDAQNLPADIAWLTPERFAAPLARWP